MDQESENLMGSELLKASRSGNIEAINRLEGRNSKIYEATTPEGNTIIHMAARFGHKDLVTKILEHDHSLVLKSNYKGETAVHLAARAGNVDVVKHFINSMKEFAKINIASIKDAYGNTPLHGAARNNHEDVIRALADSDRDEAAPARNNQEEEVGGRAVHASLCLTNDEGESPLSIAIDMRFTKLAQVIMSLEPATRDFIHQHNGQTPLHYAVIRRDYEIIKEILKPGENRVSKQDKMKRTPLHYAAALGHQKMVGKLLENDTQAVYVGDHNQQTPLHLAVKNGSKNLIETLLDKYPDTVEMVDKTQSNILHLAAKNGNYDAVSLILKLEEMEDLVNSPDINGDTPLHLAAKYYHSDVVSILCLEEKVEIRAINKFKKTALDIVKMPDYRGMELQKHLTLKALKGAYKLKAIDPDIHLEDDLERNDAITEKASQEVKKSREMAQIISVMSTLIATFTFTAAFTLPGGFESDGSDAGMATLIKETAFRAFVITDTIAMTCSITSAVIVFWSTSRRDNESFMDTLPSAIGLTWISLIAMALAFVTGLFVVLQKTLWLAILVCVIGCASPFILYILSPLLLILLEWYSKSRSSVTNRQNIVEDNPFLFIGSLLKLVVPYQARIVFTYFKSKVKCSCRCSSELASCVKCRTTRNH